MSKTLTGLLVVVCLIALGSTRISFSQEKWAHKKIEKTAKQKEHGKLYRHGGGRSLLERADTETGDIAVFADPPLEVLSADYREPETPAALLQKRVCRLSAVVVGTLANETAQFNEDKDFVFTDYEVKIEEVVKDNPQSPIQVGGNITITRDGGILKLDGRTFKAELADFKAFTKGQRFLLLLRYLPATDSYIAFAGGSFQLRENRVVPYLDTARGEIKDDPATFLNNVRVMAQNNCAK